MMQVINPLYELEIKVSKYTARGNSPEYYVAFVSTPLYGGINAPGKDIEECLTEVAKFLDGAERFRKATEDKNIPPADFQEIKITDNSINYQWKGTSKISDVNTATAKAVDHWTKFSNKFVNWLKEGGYDKPFEGDGCPAY